jgi:DMSO/TMAO reductase YedYZ molybdopterin-dependent catalytic subunit
MYEQDGKPLSEDDGKPLRLAVAGDDRLLTEGFRWVRWVDRIEVIPSG